MDSWDASRVVTGDSESPSEKAFSNTLSPLTSAGPVMGPRPGAWCSWVSSMFARARRSIIPCISGSPLALACALAIPALVAAHPIRSRMKSIDLLTMFCRLWINSSDCWANEKECSDSSGNLCRSSRSVEPEFMDRRPVWARVDERERGEGEGR